ncbi:uncharacterized protein LOC123501019 [Portunus trituberculatus]|uniref:uncharacterized protein LOC123501019 n=1 Tax=Portunus trituberculatus TaxID=210409 RepID=UPI001E1CD447|nr:uncharacterized protein LOC123501019 [Portunus trituberculatus]
MSCWLSESCEGGAGKRGKLEGPLHLDSATVPTNTYWAHKQTRSVVQRGTGQLKHRFHVLHSEVRVSPPLKVCKMVHVCAMLHNICKDRNIPIPIDAGHPDFEEQQHDIVQEVPPLPAARRNPGRLYRDEFCNLHFNNPARNMAHLPHH